jgi:hypothetical protein
VIDKLREHVPARRRITVIRAKSAGVVSNDVAIFVGAPLSSVRVTPSTTTPRLGDTIVVLVEALDESGRVVTGAKIEPVPGDTISTLLAFLSERWRASGPQRPLRG